MDGTAGFGALALAVLWVAYLVPHRLRHRQQLVEARADDRFSAGLRVVAVTGRQERSAEAARASGASTAALLALRAGLPALGAGEGTGGTTVDRPHATEERISAEAARRLAQARAARAAAAARRGAAARRRGLLATLLGIASVVGWVAAVAVPSLGWPAGAVPTGLLAAVLGLGRRAVVAGRAADAGWAATIAREEERATRPRTGAVPVVRPRTGAIPAVATSSGATAAVTRATDERTGKDTRRKGPRSGATPVVQRTRTAEPAEPEVAPDDEAPVPLVTGHAVRPSEDRTEVFARIVTDRGERGGPVRHATGETPVVRRSVLSAPTPAVPDPVQARADAATTEDDAEAWSPVPVPRPTYTMKAPAPRREPRPMDEQDVAASTAERPTREEPDAQASAPAEPLAETTGSIDLNAVLARRRAAGQ